MGSFSELMSNFDVGNARRGEQFERFCLWFLTHEPTYAQRFKRIWLWSDWPGKWSPDAGIDLVAEETDGGLWAVQVKAYDSAHTITRSDVDRFLAESSRPLFSCRLMIATTNLVNAAARSTLDAGAMPTSTILLADLEAAEVDWPVSPTRL
jgi:predicted helicase